MRVCIIGASEALTESFIRAHVERLPATVIPVYRTAGLPSVNGHPTLSQGAIPRTVRKVQRTIRGEAWEREITLGYIESFRRSGAQAVLAEYGPNGVAVMDACEEANIPLVVHFHGYDASVRRVLEGMKTQYRRLFQVASAVIVVSTHMRRRLLDIGAIPERTFLNPYGIDVSSFNPGVPENCPSIFLSVGRFVDKKAPHLTLLAFARAKSQNPEVRLRMIGDGPLLGSCRDLAVALRIDEHVEFLGPQPHEVVASEMQNCRAFLQHSVEAADGDCEGTPVAVLEAGASGLPVIATRHAGIPDVVIHEQTGLLVDERDINGMAQHIVRIAIDGDLVRKLGSAARDRVCGHYTMDQSISRLWSVIDSCIDGTVCGHGADDCPTGEVA